MTEFQGFNEDATVYADGRPVTGIAQTNPVLDTYEQVLAAKAAKREEDARANRILAERVYADDEVRHDRELADKISAGSRIAEDCIAASAREAARRDAVGMAAHQHQAISTQRRGVLDALPTPEQRALDLAVKSLLEAHGIDYAKQFDGPRGAGGALCYNVLGNSYTAVHAQGYFAEALADFITRFEPVVKDGKQLAWHTRPKITCDGDVWVAEAHLYVWKG